MIEVLSHYCFVASPIGRHNSQKRLRSDRVLAEIVRPAIEPLGFKVERADEDASPGLLTERMIRKLILAELVVVDLAGLNPNVMYELGIRHFAGSPYVQIKPRHQRSPFDLSGQFVVDYDYDLAAPATDVVRLSAAARAALQRRDDTRSNLVRAVLAQLAGADPTSYVDALRVVADLGERVEWQGKLLDEARDPRWIVQQSDAEARRQDLLRRRATGSLKRPPVE